MIKAISKQILEVSDTGNTYFEKAWLMVNPQFINAGFNRLESEAEGYLSELDAPHALKSRRNVLGRAISFLAAAAGGGLVTAAMFHLY